MLIIPAILVSAYKYTCVCMGSLSYFTASYLIYYITYYRQHTPHYLHNLSLLHIFNT